VPNTILTAPAMIYSYGLAPSAKPMSV
jgi:hypothetical protein